MAADRIIVPGTRVATPKEANHLSKKYSAIFKYLESNQGRHSVDEIMRHIFDFVDYYYKTQIGPDAVCGGRGCSHCCNIPVNLSAIEAAHISNVTGIKPKLLGQRLPIENKPDKTPCPFLVNGGCSIYPSRPVNCRVFATFDSPEFCKDGSKQHLIATSDISQALQNIDRVLAQISIDCKDEFNTPVYSDIRAYFGNAKSPFTPEWAKKERKIM